MTRLGSFFQTGYHYASVLNEALDVYDGCLDPHDCPALAQTYYYQDFSQTMIQGIHVLFSEHQELKSRIKMELKNLNRKKRSRLKKYEKRKVLQDFRLEKKEVKRLSKSLQEKLMIWIEKSDLFYKTLGQWIEEDDSNMNWFILHMWMRNSKMSTQERAILLTKVRSHKE